MLAITIEILYCLLYFNLYLIEYVLLLHKMQLSGNVDSKEVTESAKSSNWISI